MGLDNGFVIQNVNRQMVPNFVQLPFPDDDSDGIEIAYWRKCWGVRSAILDALHAHNDDYHIEVKAEDIPAIVRALRPFFKAEYWEENADSIWTFDEAFDNMLNSIINLYWAKKYMEAYPDVTMYFYDSY